MWPECEMTARKCRGLMSPGWKVFRNYRKSIVPNGSEGPSVKYGKSIYLIFMLPVFDELRKSSFNEMIG